MTNITPSDNPVKRGRGKPRDPNALRFYDVGLRPAQRAYLERWATQEGDNLTTCLGELLDRAMKMFPGGPNAFGHRSTKVPKKRLPGAALAVYAAEKGIRVEDAPAVALREFFEMTRREK